MEDSTIRHLAESLSEELQGLKELLDEALTDQWERGAVDTVRKPGQAAPTAEHPARPTEAIVSDGRRLLLRGAVEGSGSALRDALILVRASRLALDRSHRRWKGLPPAEDV